MYLLKIIDDAGHFELIDGDFIVLYRVNQDELIALSDKQYQQYRTLNADDIVFRDGKFVGRPRKPSEAHEWNGSAWIISPEKMTALFMKRKEKLMILIADKTDNFKLQYLAGYSQAEIDSFYRQEREARNELPLMLLTEIFEGRDDLKSIDELKHKVIEKADLFAIIMGKLFAIKQGFETRIENAQTAEELEQIELEIDKWQKL